MKIALVENFGADFVGARLRFASYLKEKGYDVTAIVPKDGHKEIIEARGIRVIEVGSSVRGKGLSVKLDYYRELKKNFKKEKFDVIHLFRLQPNLIGTFVAGLFTSSKIISHVTGLGVTFSSKTFKNRVLQVIIKAFYRMNHLLFSPYIVYQNSYDSYDLGIHKRTVCIWGSAVDEDRFDNSNIAAKTAELSRLRADLNIEPATKVFLFVSRLLKEKGVLELIEAFKNIENEGGYNIKLFIVGWSDDENPSMVTQAALETLIKDLDSISFLGKRDDIELLLEISHVSILPTYYREGTPRSLLESMVMKNAIITTNMPGCNHLIDEGKNGILIAPRSVEAIEDSVKKILTRDLEELGLESYQRYHNKFSEKIVYSSIERLYKSIVSINRVADVLKI